MIDIILQTSIENAQEQLARYIGLSFVLLIIVVYIILRDIHLSSLEKENKKATNLSFRYVPIRHISKHNVFNEEYTKSRHIPTFFSRFYHRLKGNLKSYDVQVQVKETKDSNGNSIYLSKIVVYLNRSSKSYKLASDDYDSLLNDIDKYKNSCYNDEFPKPSISEKQYYFVKHGFCDFNKNRRRITSDTLTRIHSNVSNTKPSSISSQIKDSFKSESERIRLDELRKVMIEEFRYPQRYVDNWLEFLIDHGHISIDEDGYIYSHMS